MRAPWSTRASRSRIRLALAIPLLAWALAGCDLTGEEALAKAAAQREADGKAVGSACRHGGRAIEDCYTLNPKAQRAAVFAGWREMDEYMRENKLEALAPSLPPAGAKPDKGERGADRAGEKSSSKSSERSGERSDAHAARADKRPSAEPTFAEATTGKVELPAKPRVSKPNPS